MNIQTAKSCGFNYGTDAIEHCTVDKYDQSDACCRCDEVCDECLTVAASNAETRQREYSPFEFLAAEFNDSEENDDLWEAYEEGVMDGIQAGMAARLAAKTRRPNNNNQTKQTL